MKVLGIILWWIIRVDVKVHAASFVAFRGRILGIKWGRKSIALVNEITSESTGMELGGPDC